MSSFDQDNVTMFADFTTAAPPVDNGPNLELINRMKYLQHIFDVNRRIDNYFYFTGGTGTVVNLAVIIVMLACRYMLKKPFNCFVLHQSIIDGLVCLVLCFKIYYRTMQNWDMTKLQAELFCKIWLSNVVMFGLCTVSTCNLVFMSLERYQAIKSPFTYDVERIKKKLVSVFIAAWVIAVILQIPTMIHLYIDTDKKGFYRCRSNMLTSRWIGFTVLAIYGVTNVIVPCAVMFYVYVQMGLILYAGRNIAGGEANESGSARNKSLRKAHANILQTCVILSIFYILTYGVYYVILSKLIIINDGMFYTIEYYFSQYVVTVNSLVNPFVYAIRYNEFQDAAKFLITGKKSLSRSGTLNKSVSAVSKAGPKTDSTKKDPLS